MAKRLLGKISIVTGANSGMGMATARALLKEGAAVIMLCRNEKRGKEAYNELVKDGNSRTYLILCDLGDYESVRAFARQVREQFGRVDVLVNNAGFISLDRQETKEGLERQFGINHIGLVHRVDNSQTILINRDRIQTVERMMIDKLRHFIYDINIYITLAK